MRSFAFPRFSRFITDFAYVLISQNFDDERSRFRDLCFRAQRPIRERSDDVPIPRQRRSDQRPVRRPLPFISLLSLAKQLSPSQPPSTRWATEDPNPAAKRAEIRHLTKEGEEGIAKALDPDFVQSVREMDELEGIVEPRVFDPEGEDYARDVRVQKRARVQDGGGGGEGEAAQVAPAVAPLPREEPPVPAAVAGGLLSAHALDSLKLMASMRQQQVKVVTPPVVKQPPTSASVLGGLGDYGSDDDDDE